MEAGEGAWTDGAARDGKTSRILTGKEAPPASPVPTHMGSTAGSDRQGTAGKSTQSPSGQHSRGSCLCCCQAQCPAGRPLFLCPPVTVRLHHIFHGVRGVFSCAAPFLGFLRLPQASSLDSVPFSSSITLLS